MKNKPFLKIDKRVSNLSNTDAFIYLILVYSKFQNKEISRGYLKKCLNSKSEDAISHSLKRIEDAGLINREKKYHNSKWTGQITREFRYTLNYDKFFMINPSFVRNEDINPKMKGFALRLRTLAFDDSLEIKLTTAEIADEMDICSKTVRGYLNSLTSIINDRTFSAEYFIKTENTFEKTANELESSIRGLDFDHYMRVALEKAEKSGKIRNKAAFVSSLYFGFKKDILKHKKIHNNLSYQF